MAKEILFYILNCIQSCVKLFTLIENYFTFKSFRHCWLPFFAFKDDDSLLKQSLKGREINEAAVLIFRLVISLSNIKENARKNLCFSINLPTSPLSIFSSGKT